MFICLLQVCCALLCKEVAKKKHLNQSLPFLSTARHHNIFSSLTCEMSSMWKPFHDERKSPNLLQPEVTLREAPQVKWTSGEVLQTKITLRKAPQPESDIKEVLQTELTSRVVLQPEPVSGVSAARANLKGSSAVWSSLRSGTTIYVGLRGGPTAGTSFSGCQTVSSQTLLFL